MASVGRLRWRRDLFLLIVDVDSVVGELARVDEQVVASDLGVGCDGAVVAGIRKKLLHFRDCQVHPDATLDSRPVQREVMLDLFRSTLVGAGRLLEPVVALGP